MPTNDPTPGSGTIPVPTPDNAKHGHSTGSDRSRESSLEQLEARVAELERKVAAMGSN